MKYTKVLLLAVLPLIFGCGEDPETPPTYTPLGQQILGSWIVTSTTDNGNQSTTTYPATIDEYTITFGDDGRVSLIGPCNGGAARAYIFTEGGSLIFYDVITLQKFCSTTENAWEADIKNAIENAYFGSISGSNLEILSDGDYSLSLVRK